MEPEHRNTYRIGAILDGGVMVLRDDHRNVERNVYFCTEDDGMKVVRITNIFDSPDGMQK